ncbi:MAG: LysR family transcriptional regulator [Pseudomonadota bacterium]
MDMVLLRTFETVAREGSFVGAARALNCVQSNVTARIRRLEENFGAPLFERGRGGARLTDLGRQLHGYAVDLIARFEAAERDLKDAAGCSAPLRLGTMETTAAGRLPDVLRKLRDACPSAPVSVTPGPTGELLADLWERRLDSAFVAGPLDEDRFDGVVAFEEDLVLIRAVPLTPDLPLLAFRSTCSYRRVADRWLEAQGQPDRPVMEMGTLDGILGCMAAGIGFAIVPRSSFERRADFGTLSVEDLPAEYARTKTYLAWRRDHHKSSTQTRLIELVESEP